MTNPMSDAELTALVEQLEAMSDYHREYGQYTRSEQMSDAAQAITELRERVAELKTILHPLITKGINEIATLPADK